MNSLISRDRSPVSLSRLTLYVWYGKKGLSLTHVYPLPRACVRACVRSSAVAWIRKTISDQVSPRWRRRILETNERGRETQRKKKEPLDQMCLGGYVTDHERRKVNKTSKPELEHKKDTEGGISSVCFWMKHWLHLHLLSSGKSEESSVTEVRVQDKINWRSPVVLDILSCP